MSSEEVAPVPVQSADVWMIECRRSLCHVLELGSRDNIFWEKFQCDEPVQAHVLGLVHHTHATTEFFENAIVGDGLANQCVGVRHSAAILAPSTPLGWLDNPEKLL